MREGNVVVFRDFSVNINPKYEQKEKDGREYRVTTANYDSVIANIMKQVADYQART